MYKHPANEQELEKLARETLDRYYHPKMPLSSETIDRLCALQTAIMASEGIPDLPMDGPWSHLIHCSFIAALMMGIEMAVEAFLGGRVIVTGDSDDSDDSGPSLN